MKVRTGVVLLLLLGALLLLLPTPAWGQGPAEATPGVPEEPVAPEQVSVEPSSHDQQIQARLLRILEATGWYERPVVEVREGIVFLDGTAATRDYRTWAGDLATNTDDVVAVVNRMEVAQRALWDFALVRSEIFSWTRSFIQALPVVAFAALILLFTWWLARGVVWLAQPILHRHFPSPLIVTVVSRTIALPIFLLGIYLVLQVSGLTRLAVTVLGGTGLAGIVIGFAFRDIAENFLSSILLGMRQPFQSDDMIEVAGYSGIVQQLNMRTTILMTLDGNHIQIPNSTVFKNVITNYSTNPNRRVTFKVGISYDDSLADAQSALMSMLEAHPAVLEHPDSLVLVDEMGASSINLVVYAWFDATIYSPVRIKSSLIRLARQALYEAGITIPDEAREVVFPQGVPIITPEQHAADDEARRAEQARRRTPEPIATPAERLMRSDDAEIMDQAAQARVPETGEDLLTNEKKG